MTKRTTRIVVKAVWINPFFKRGYSQYQVQRLTENKLCTDEIEVIGRETLFKTNDLFTAVDFRDELIKNGVI